MVESSHLRNCQRRPTTAESKRDDGLLRRGLDVHRRLPETWRPRLGEERDRSPRCTCAPPCTHPSTGAKATHSLESGPSAENRQRPPTSGAPSDVPRRVPLAALEVFVHCGVVDALEVSQDLQHWPHKGEQLLELLIPVWRGQQWDCHAALEAPHERRRLVRMCTQRTTWGLRMSPILTRELPLHCRLPRHVSRSREHWDPCPEANQTIQPTATESFRRRCTPSRASSARRRPPSSQPRETTTSKPRVGGRL